MEMIRNAEAISLFCRLHMRQKRELPIRASEMGLLIYIVRNPDKSTPVQAAHFFRVSKPMVTAMARVLERQGYITKVPSLEDGRSFTLCPTQAARAMVEETYREYTGKIEVLQKRMGNEDFTQLIKLLKKANCIMEEEKVNG